MRMYLLTVDDMADNIMTLNLTRKGKTFLVSKLWFKKCVVNGFIDKCDFNINVSKFKFYPIIPFEL